MYKTIYYRAVRKRHDQRIYEYDEGGNNKY
jgi:hypothetical protein